MNKVILLLTFSILLLVPVGVQNAFSHGNVDQSFTGPFDGADAIRTLPGNPLHGQGFTPTASNLVAVDIFMIDNTSGANSDTITVRIKDGNVPGFLDTLPVLGSTSKVVTKTGANVANPRVEHFDFTTPISLNPGGTYFIELEATSGSTILFAWADSSGDPYPGGQQVILLTPGNRDFGFRTYYEDNIVGGEIIPIETTSLILANIQSFSWMIPVVLSVLGIGLFVFSRKTE